VNEAGQAVGASGACVALNPISLLYLQPLHALLWDNGVVTDLGNLGGTGNGGGISANAINNNGQVVGVSDLPGDKTFHAFLWTKGTAIKDLGTVATDVGSDAIAINDAGDVVGVSVDNEFFPRAFLRPSGGTMIDLNSLAPDSPLYLFTACSINARGEIIGIGLSVDGAFHAYLASPGNGAARSTNTSVAAPGRETERGPASLPAIARKLLSGYKGSR
jgi:probable HAF family extracellular repeat protein